MPVKPNFFIIGAPKAGTTALSEYLRSHPNVYFSQPKEPEYFATDFKRVNFGYFNNFDNYMGLFKKANSSIHKAIGEGSAIYIFSKVAVENILKFQPNAKLIVSVRNPAELVISLHSQLLKNGFENERVFIKAWQLEEARKSGKFIPSTCLDVKELFYSERGKLGTQLKRILNIVPREQIKIILFDDFVANPRKIYREVLDFLELPDDGRMEFPRINERVVIKYFTLHRFLAILWRFWLPLRQVIREGKGFGLFDYLTKWNSVPAQKKIEQEIYAKLLAFYKDEIMILEEILNRNLRHWLTIPHAS
ncbi:MAG: sulfotransferase [Desulfobacterota bacterium]|nr:sulfotransferase [Thermodesulfobacteriota bacterium]